MVLFTPYGTGLIVRSVIASEHEECIAINFQIFAESDNVPDGIVHTRNHSSVTTSAIQFGRSFITVPLLCIPLPGSAVLGVNETVPITACRINHLARFTQPLHPTAHPTIFRISHGRHRQARMRSDERER